MKNKSKFTMQNFCSKYNKIVYGERESAIDKALALHTGNLGLIHRTSYGTEPADRIAEHIQD